MAGKPTSKFTDAQKAAMFDEVLKNVNDDDSKFNFDEFYIQKQCCGVWEGRETACNNYITENKDFYTVYAACVKKFKIEPFKTIEEYATAAVKVLEHVAQVDWDSMCDDEYNELHAKAKRIVKAKPNVPKATRAKAKPAKRTRKAR